MSVIVTERKDRVILSAAGYIGSDVVYNKFVHVEELIKSIGCDDIEVRADNSMLAIGSRFSIQNNSKESAWECINFGCIKLEENRTIDLKGEFVGANMGKVDFDLYVMFSEAKKATTFLIDIEFADKSQIEPLDTQFGFIGWLESFLKKLVAPWQQA